MSLEAESTAWIVRQTARAAAVLFSVYLACCFNARRRPAVQRWVARSFGGYVVAHTIHFGCVIALAVATDGANIHARGGWLAAVASGVAFYGVLGWIGWGEARRLSIGRTRRGWPSIAIVGIWLAFFQAWALRAGQSPTYTALSVVLIAALALYLASLFPVRGTAAGDL